ncbi:hypothetical protein D210916BOD24_27290 [Alteromonas sp. D210916BOD_24]|uniref:type II secretion system protein n=1 Tax=Alteromonas sp. D210916BOD_24 TaxID=3157618 RepID=UPI00399CAD2F
MRQLGFTLIEVLVVLVIMSLTTTLLVTGLSTTWANFDKLTAKNLRATSSNMPQQWFNQSYKGAVMFHPYEPNFVGTPQKFSHVTTTAPSAEHSTPQNITWQLTNCTSTVCDLQFSINEAEPITIAALSRTYQFYYLINGEWQEGFQPDNAVIPAAIKLSANNKDWTLVTAGRPVNADIPAELPPFGKYEF